MKLSYPLFLATKLSKIFENYYEEEILLYRFVSEKKKRKIFGFWVFFYFWTVLKSNLTGLFENLTYLYYRWTWSWNNNYLRLNTENKPRDVSNVFNTFLFAWTLFLQNFNLKCIEFNSVNVSDVINRLILTFYKHVER